MPLIFKAESDELSKIKNFVNKIFDAMLDPNHNNVKLSNNWIFYRGKSLIYLPYEYRSYDEISERYVDPRPLLKSILEEIIKRIDTITLTKVENTFILSFNELITFDFDEHKILLRDIFLYDSKK